MRRVALAAAVFVIAGCSAPQNAGTAPTASASATPTTPAATALVSPTATTAPGEIRVPLESGQAPVNADSEALLVARRLIDGRTTRIEAVELKAGKVSTVRETVDGNVTASAIRDGVVTLTEMYATDQPQQYRLTVLAGRWRDPASIARLDDITIPIAGGDSWNPYPDPQTNGFEVAWLHASRDLATFELRVRDASGVITTPFTSKDPFTFALARNGDVAIGDLILVGHSGDATLHLLSGGAAKTLATRPAGGAGYVVWQSGRILWSNGLGLVTPMTAVERIDPGTLAHETITPPPGCSTWIGGTDAQLAFACADHIELQGPGPARIGPPLPLLHPRSIVRLEQGPPPIAYVTPVVTDDPRPGTGARF